VTVSSAQLMDWTGLPFSSLMTDTNFGCLRPVDVGCHTNHAVYLFSLLIVATAHLPPYVVV